MADIEIQPLGKYITNYLQNISSYNLTTTLIANTVQMKEIGGLLPPTMRTFYFVIITMLFLFLFGHVIYNTPVCTAKVLK